MADPRAETAAVLDDMVAGIMGIKADKAVRLTPVGTETARLPEVPNVFMAPEALADVAKDLRRQAQLLLDVAAGIDVILGVPEAVNAEHARKDAVEQKLAEREADRRVADREAAESGDKRAAARVSDTEAFDERMARLQAEAQAAVFKAADVESDDAPSWTCPTHGATDIRHLTSPKGRKYDACGVPNCKDFQK